MTTYDETHDADLVRKAADGNQRAWRLLVDRFSGLIWSVARAHRLQGADARDVSQTTWMRLVEHIRGLRDPDRVGGWLATTARHECLRLLRRRARMVPMEEEAMPEQVAEAVGEERVLTSERDEALRRAFAALSQNDQALLRMLVADPPLSYREIGAALGMPLGSIGPTRARCLKRLRANLRRESPEYADGVSPVYASG